MNFAQVSVLGLAVLVAYALVAPVAVATGGPGGLAASATAAALCLLGAEAALIASRAVAQRGKMLEGVLVGSALRMGIPLTFGLALQVSVKPLADAYLLVYLLVFYPVTLFVETFLSLRGASAPRSGKGRSSQVAS